MSTSQDQAKSFYFDHQHLIRQGTRKLRSRFPQQADDINSAAGLALFKFAGLYQDDEDQFPKQAANAIRTALNHWLMTEAYPAVLPWRDALRGWSHVMLAGGLGADGYDAASLAVPDRNSDGPIPAESAPASDYLMLLNEQERCVVVALLGFDGSPPVIASDLARKLKVSRQRIHQIRDRAIAKMRTRSEPNFVNPPRVARQS